jgi:hypothetical protein
MHPYEQFLREDLRNEEFENGQREVLLRLLTERFGSLPAGITQRVGRASRSELERWVGRILEAASLDDVFAG